MHLLIVVKMNIIFAFLAASLIAVQGVPTYTERIIGGSLTTVSTYPYASSLLYSWNLVNYYQACAGTILTTRAILTASHCIYGDSSTSWRVRVGSSYANSGGAVHGVANLITHPSFNSGTLNNDVAIIRTASTIVYIPNAVQPASISGTNYNLADNQPVLAIGWGTTSVNGASSEQLRHVQVWTVNQAVCRSRYIEIGWSITDSMVCSGWLDVGGRDQCSGDSGGPLIHNNVIVGICSFGNSCAQPRYPGVNTRVSRFTSWIQSNA